MISYKWWYSKSFHPMTWAIQANVWEGWFLFWIIPIYIRKTRTVLDA